MRGGMPFFSRWRLARQLQRRAAEFVQAVTAEPREEDVAWLARVGTRGDDDHARWELRYASRAIGLLVAQRDALDDRTASVVAAVLSDSFGRDAMIDANRRELAERQFNARLSAYSDALRARPADSPARLGQTLLAFSGGSFRDVDENVIRAGEILLAFEKDANSALRRLFGAAALPEHVPPSALAGDPAR